MDLEKEKTEKRNQQLEVFKENDILLSLDSNFVVALLPAFKDQRCACVLDDADNIEGDPKMSLWKKDTLHDYDAHI